MNLDELHKVMKGDMTTDQACEGMTDDFEIGHVSHRADGDYRKVAQGQWKKVTAKEFMDKARADSAAGWKADIEKKKEQIKSMEKRRDEHPENAKGWQEEIDRTNKEIGDIEKRIANAEGAKPAEQQGGGTDGEVPIAELNDLWKRRHQAFMKNWKGEEYKKLNREANAMIDKYRGKIKLGEHGWELEKEAQPAPAESKPAEEPKADGGKRQLKKRADGTPIYETPDDVIYDMVENYNELDRGDLQGVIEAAAMSHGWDENEILEEVDRQATGKYGLGVDSASPRLTRDTKIRLSRIKREQTQDERRTYKIGEISEKTGLQKTANGWREVKKGGAAAGAPKAEPKQKLPKYYEDLGDLVDEKRALRDKTKNRDEQRKLNGEIRELLQKMDTAPFGGKKSESYKRKQEQRNAKGGAWLRGDKITTETVNSARVGDKIDLNGQGDYLQKEDADTWRVYKKDGTKTLKTFLNKSLPSDYERLTSTGWSAKNADTAMYGKANGGGGGQGQMAEKKAYEENKKLTDFYDRTGIRNPNEALARNMVEKEESKQENLKAGNRDDSMFKENDSVEFNRYGNTLKGKIERVDKKWNGEVRLLVKAEDGKSYWAETGDITKHPASENPADQGKK